MALAEAVCWLSAGRATGQLVVDRAEDLRRAVSIHAEVELPIGRRASRCVGPAPRTRADLVRALGSAVRPRCERDGEPRSRTRRAVPNTGQCAGTRNSRALIGRPASATESQSHAISRSFTLTWSGRRSSGECSGGDTWDWHTGSPLGNLLNTKTTEMHRVWRARRGLG